VNTAQIGPEQRVHEHDQYGPAHVRLRETNGIRGAQLLCLLDRYEPEIRVLGLQVFLDLVGQVTHDPYDLVHACLFEQIEHPVEHGSISHAEQRLGPRVGVGPESGSLSGERKYGLHATLTDVLMEGVRSAGT
jgi:hypothetical protein